MGEKRIEKGYILLARKILTSEIMKKPPLYLKLWIWMLEKANHKPWKNLDRGQFRTTISEMQEEMSWMVGYRKVVPSINQIRGVYETLTKTSMINTTKTTRGMIITIRKYKHYQECKNYEEHNEETTKPETTTHYIQETKETNNNTPVPSIPLKDKTEYIVDEDFVKLLSSTYQYVNLSNELPKIRAWCIANPSKQKTRRGAKRFINGWIERANERASKEKGKTFEPKYESVN